MRAQQLTLAALTLAAGLSLTACQGEDSTATSDASDSAAASSSSGSGRGTGSGEQTPTGGGSAETSDDGGGDAKNVRSAPGSGTGKTTAGRCRTSDLLFEAAHGMAEGDLVVSFRNIGGDACSLKGFPGVDLTSPEAGAPLSAERSDRTAPAVALGSGEETRFTLHCPPNDTGGSGVPVSSILVTPPGETRARELPVSISVPARPGAADRVTIDPVGTGKQ
ncbi:DUF4232 domain-containing protein [Streptomyces sp. NPDC006992]|uniref:DUF4232 domain-containing protein n=1 Tax=unclassified Streptomyces TaxID=2593676 RepID=UPI0034002A24